jgi:uncharacterized protein
MKQFETKRAPGQLTVIAALLAGLSAPAFAVSPDLVISQVYGGGGNSGSLYRNDFIEIFNRGTAPVNLSGKSVQYGSSAGTTWTVNALPNVTLQPGQFFLIQEAAGADLTKPLLPTVDHVGAPVIAMAGGGAKVILANGTTALTGANPFLTAPASVIDMLGWGSVNGSETTAAAGTANATAARRINACIDTDVNAADFVVGAPTPRNTATPATPCGGSAAIVASCPASLSVQQGVFGTTVLTAKDEDGIVGNAAITAGAVPGIALSDFVAASGNNEAASVNLSVAASTPAGNYPVVVNFSNGDSPAQEKSCTVNVNVAGIFALTHTIPQIQGSGATSPYKNTVQTTEGVITHKVSTGFFIQDASGDNDPTSSDGLFVFMGNTPVTAAVGDLVRVTGTVVEYTPTGANRSYTEMKDTTQLIVQSSGNVVTPTNVSALENLAAVEGMLVNFTGGLTVNQASYLGDRGELTLSVGRRETPTNRHAPGSAGALAMAAANATNLIVLDDSVFVKPAVIPYIGEDTTVRVGDTVNGLTGVIDFGAIGGGGAAFKLQPTLPPQFSRTNARELAPSVAAGNVRVASANVLNFFTTFMDGKDYLGNASAGCSIGNTIKVSNCRGADNLFEYTRQRDKIVNELKAIDADVVGLMEIQNNGDLALGVLVDALNAAVGYPAYAYVPMPPATGTDAIRVAMLYKPAKVALAGPSMSDDNAINNRPPMAQTFKHPNGAKFSVVVNHLKSKGSCGGGAGNTDSGDGQGCWNLTRVQQASRLVNSFLPQVTAAAGDPDVLVIGDMNSHGFEDPIRLITDAGYVNELERFVRPHGIVYSYVFDGESGYLDHALASASLDAQVAGATEWHNNADEPDVIDYNTDGKSQDLYVNNAFRASDHDPVVISLNLAPTWFDMTSSFAVTKYAPVLNRTTGKYTAKLTFKNTTAATINGPFHVTFSGLAAGVTVDGAAGTKDGAPYITAANGTLAAGATATLNVTFSNPAKVGISYSNAIYTGSF